MSLPPLPLSAISIGVHAEGWRAAVTAAGAALERSGATSASYAERMVAVIEEFGAYVVIAPGLALAHARPGTDVLRDGLSVVTLAEPVNFGHPHNDPVSVVVGLAVSSADQHVHFVAELANVFNTATVIPTLAAATDAEGIRSLFGLGLAHTSSNPAISPASVAARKAATTSGSEDAV
ncbi:PTS sugar transporter subunit IIA [Cryobacterium frigoriphilum]|uniref:Ascorbate-specific PTS system EIIA component n=1 Tax=Cryobacterium frigoriphilum TaxID=1259150 RepID=A0A4R9A937_9MICO|nr:PTS sugar transporter subunit IIA [Cryobacterium frigoriphilum]TFD54188.1 PTS sugar transporter subunit IIA [Cryobacterium frigoriphilum]